MSIVSYIMLHHIMHLNNGFSFDEAPYSVIFWMWLERHFSLQYGKDAIYKD